VFYINVPIGSLAFLGLLSALPESPISKSRFDFFGFSALSLSIGALQLVLDRGQMKDWFSSTEICIEAIVAAAGFYLFTVHMLTTTRERFVNLSLFKDGNFLAGNALIFAVGVVLFATLALLPTFLQELLNYPVVTTGLVIAPPGNRFDDFVVYGGAGHGENRRTHDHRRRFWFGCVFRVANDRLQSADGQPHRGVVRSRSGPGDRPHICTCFGRRFFDSPTTFA
jgi:hypothetical protein